MKRRRTERKHPTLPPPTPAALPGADPAQVERLRRENERLRKENAEQAKRIADLERQLALREQNSTITSKPPSSDGLAGQPRVRGRRVKSRRKPGGQPGHPGHHRALVPAERVDVIVDLAPEACGQCARRLHARHTLGDPRRHQVTELPAIAAHITEYRCQRRQCPDCGTITLAALPDEHANQFGPQLTALIAYLTVVCRMPRLVVQRFLEGALQIPISLGSTQHAWEEASTAVAAPYAELEAALPHEPVITADETGHRTNGEKRWLWTFVARTFVVYRIATSRGSDVLQVVLGDTFSGILGSDRLPAYLKFVVDQRQFCWAHVTRNLLSALDLATTPAATRFCREALALDRRLFRLWHRFRGAPGTRGSPLTRAELIAKALPIEKRLFALGARHLDAANADVRNLAYAFFVHNPHFFRSCMRTGSRPPTMPPREPSARPFNGGRSCSGREARPEVGERERLRLILLAVVVAQLQVHAGPARRRVLERGVGEQDARLHRVQAVDRHPGLALLARALVGVGQPRRTRMTDNRCRIRVAQLVPARRVGVGLTSAAPLISSSTAVKCDRDSCRPGRAVRDR